MKLFLNGGGCGNQTLLAYREINKIINHNKPVLYIPLAILEKAKEEKSLDDYSLIYIGGGNTYKLLNGLKKAKTYDKLKKYLLNDEIIDSYDL